MIALATALAVALTAAGCGGSDSGDSGEGDGGTTTASGSVSKTAFIKEIDAVCTSVGKQTELEFTNYAKENNIALTKEPKLTPAQKEHIVDAILLPALHEQVGKIRSAEVPAGDQDQVAAIIKAIEEAIETAENDPAAVESPTKLLAGADKLLRSYGFKVCGNR
jgi:hypothetical protein